MNNISSFEDEVSFVDILKFFFRYWKIITLCTLFFFLLGVFSFVFYKKNEYIAESGIIILGAKPELIIGLKAGFLGVKELVDIYLQRLEDRKKTVVEIAKTPKVISSVIEKAKDQLEKKKLKLSLKDFFLLKAIC